MATRKATGKAKATATEAITPKRGKPEGTTPKKSATQQRVDALTAQLEEGGYKVVESNGKYNIKKGSRAKKFIAENLTVSGLEAHTIDLVGDKDDRDRKPDEVNKAIAAEMDGNSPDKDAIAAAPNMQIASVPQLIAEGDDDEVISEVNWDIGKGKAPMGDKKAQSAHTYYKGKNLYLVEAKYAPDTWGVYLEKASLASAVKGLENAKQAAISAAEKLAEAEASGKLDELEQVVKTSNKRTQQVLEKAADIDADNPIYNPNTDPRVAATLRQVFEIPREADLIGKAATPTQEVNAAINTLEPLQVKGELTLTDLLQALNRPTDTKRVEIAVFLAQNGVEISFIGGDRIQLRTVAPAISVLEEPLSKEEELDLERFL